MRTYRLILILMLLSTTLMACLSSPPVLVITELPILGQVDAWNRGDLKLRLVPVSNPHVSAADSSLDATGAFSLILPKVLPTKTVFDNGGLARAVDCDNPQFVQSPPYSSGVGYNLEVVNAKGATVGTLFLASSRVERFSVPTAGVVRSWLYFSLVVSSLNGWCRGFHYDLKLNPGWNVIFLQGQTDGTALVRNVAPSAALTWFFQPQVYQFKLSGDVPHLDIEQSLKLSATALDELGQPIPDALLSWTSSNPDVAEVAADGTLRAKANGRFTASVRSGFAQVSTQDIFVSGLEARGGTFNTGAVTLGTAFVLQDWGLANRGPPTDQSVTVRGPTTWNGGQAVTLNWPANQQRYRASFEGIAAVSGEYTASNGQQTYVFKLDATQRLEPVKIDSLTALNSQQGRAAWTLPQDAETVAVFMNVMDRTTNRRLDRPLDNWAAFTQWEWLLDPGVLDLTHRIDLQITTFGSERKTRYGILPAQINLSRTSRGLDFTPAVTGLSFNGAPGSGKLRLKIQGQFFTNGSSVKFGNVASSAVSLDSEWQLSAIVPAGSLGTVDVTVTTPAGSSATSDKIRFRYFEHSEYNVYTQARLLAGANGVMWFLGGEGSLVLGKIQNGTVSTFELPKNWTPNEVSDFMIGSDGQVWLLRTSANAGITDPSQFVKFNPVNSTFGTPFDSPRGHANAFANQISMIVLGPDQNIWAVMRNINLILKLNPNDGSLIEEFTLPFETGVSSQGDLVAGPGNTIWFNGFSTWYGQNKLARVTTTGTISVFDTKLDGGYGICNAPDGNIWISGDDHLLKLGADGNITKYEHSSSGFPSDRYAASRHLVVDNNQHFWFGRSVLRRMNTSGQDLSVGVFDVTPSTGSADFIQDVARDSNGKIWYSRGNYVGVLTP